MTRRSGVSFLFVLRAGPGDWDEGMRVAMAVGHLAEASVNMTAAVEFDLGDLVMYVGLGPAGVCCISLNERRLRWTEPLTS